MTSLTILKENLTWETFLVELSRARKGSTIGNKFGYLCMGAIPFNQNVWFQFSATSSTEWNFAPECLKFLVEWFAFRKSFRKSGNFSGKILYQLPLFPKFFKFWLNGKRPKCIQEILVLRESSARITYDVQKYVLHVQIRRTNLSITYN